MIHKLLMIFIALLIAAGSIFALRVSSERLDLVHAKNISVVELPPLAEFDPAIVNILFAGHKRVYDAFISIWITQVIDDPRLQPHHADDLVQMVRVISRHEPVLEKTLYIATCVVLMQKLQRPDLCFPVTELGMNTITDSWMIPLTQGFVEGSVLKNKERAAFFYFIASQKKDVPEYVGNAAAKLSNQSGNLTNDEYLKTFDMMMNIPGGEGFLNFLNGALSRESADE